MVEIIPSINVRTFEEVKERIAKVEPYVKWCHLDVTDDIFSKHITWNDPKDLSNLKTPLSIEVHLMVAEPEKIIDSWLVKPIKRVVVHLETVKNSRRGLFFELARSEPVELVEKIPFLSNSSRLRSNSTRSELGRTTLELIVRKCREAKIEIGLAVSPETPAEGLNSWLGKVDMIQVLAVHPGSSGQQSFWPEMLGKIRYIREHCGECIIEADGGINPETAKEAARAGANLLAAGAYVFNSSDIGRAIDSLKSDISYA